MVKLHGPHRGTTSIHGRGAVNVVVPGRTKPQHDADGRGGVLLDCSYGFRPKRSAHDGIRVLNRASGVVKLARSTAHYSVEPSS